MRNPLLWLSLCLLSLLAGAKRWDVPPLPAEPPRQRVVRVELDRTITLHVEVDETFAAQHGDAVEQVVREAIATHNVEWRRYRREWFALGRLTIRASPGSERDASYLLARFLQRTAEERDAIHVNIFGRQLEVYTSGTHATPIGGLAYRGADAVLVSAPPGVPVELLAYYLFHELGHCWDALDIPFHGGDSTFGSKTRMTFHVDAGNEELMEDSAGPLPRTTPRRAPMVLREKLFRAWAALRESPHAPALHDLLLHEPSLANPSYMAKKRALLDAAGPHEEQIRDVLRPYELTRQQLHDDRELREQLAQHYWRVNDAIKSRDYDAAEAELEAIRAIAVASPDVHMLVGAVERKARRRR